MLGAIIGDIVGSVYEFGSHKSKKFSLLTHNCHPTDDSILTIAVGLACVESDTDSEYSFKKSLVYWLKKLCLDYPNAGYGKSFYEWAISDSEEPYGGNTNGSAMRVSPVAYACDTLEDAERLAGWSAEVTHDHPEGIRGAMAVASAVFLARTGHTKCEIKKYITANYYNLNFTVDEIRPGYKHDMSCEGSVPQAIVCFLDSTDFEDAIRNAISLGGDGDTQACIAGAIAEAYYGIPDEIAEKIFDYIDEDLQEYYFEYAEELY